MRIDGFRQIEAFYSWVFNNSDKVRPTHISLYLFLWNQGNRAHWVEWFKCPYDLAMNGACIGNKGTYYRCLDDLQKFQLIKYKKGLNNYKAPQIHLFQLYDNGQLTEQVSVPLSEQVSEHLSEPLTELLSGNIYKLITDNYKLVNSNLIKWMSFHDNDSKKGLLININKEDVPSEDKEYFEIAFNIHLQIKNNIEKAGGTVIKLNKATYKNWVDPIRLMMTVDGVTRDSLNKAAIFSVRDSEFWKKNIYSTGKFREKYEQLILASNEQQTKKGGVSAEFLERLHKDLSSD